MRVDIVLLRHAEKPDKDGDEGLSVAGHERAAALSVLLQHRFGRPDYLFAARDSDESHRPRLTLVPLSEATGLPIDTTFENKDREQLARHLVSERIRPGTLVIVAWHQGTLPDLASALGPHDAPRNWPDHIYDRIWHIRRSEDGRTRLEVIQQRLMFGDAE